MKNFFVGNMSFQTTESDLRALFEPFGAASVTPKMACL
jgi:RNA recognition motif-containing protein